MPFDKGVVKVTDAPAGFPQPYPAAGSEHRADEVRVAFAGSAPQRRLTVFFRVFMVIPQYIVLYALSIAAEILLFISWWAALFTGRVPVSLADFLAGYLRWYGRVTAYAWLLTDQYPPFALTDQAYPVRIAVTPVPLNRLAVLFRIFLALPAFIVAALATWGTAIASFVIWLIALIAGRLPDALYQALAAILRYLIRAQGYWLLVSATYPGGLFGDQPAAGQPVADAAAEPGAAEPGAAGGGTPEPAAGETVPAAGETVPAGTAPAQAGPGEAEASAAVPAQPAVPAGAVPGGALPEPASWLLALSTGARRLVGFFLGLGAAGLIAYVVVLVLVVGSAGSRASAISDVNQAHTTLVQTLNQLQTQVSACSATDVRCVGRQYAKAADAFDAFSSSLAGTSMPDSASQAASSRLQQDSTRIAADYRRLATATSVLQFEQIMASSGLRDTLIHFEGDYQQLGAALGASNG